MSEISQKLPAPLVTVVIPTYNYADKIGRAIQSVKDQKLSNFECFIVDDGSTDDTKRVVKGLIKDDRRFHYIYQENAGVANARNKGVFSSSAPYVCCLDADDAIAPEFLEACVSSLRDDPSLGIAYTGLWYILPDGNEGLSSWPDEFDYDDQLKGKNQIPTCNVARRSVWQRLGGQRQRYAPKGAGEEDAEMWLRAGAYGIKARKITQAGLFIYSWKSGRVSGDPDHSVTNYRLWHPWAQDNYHPFASYATPRHFSHPVRQYDEPAISVIIPVGPDHDKDMIAAMDSLDAQTMRKWEAIVVDDTGTHTEDMLRNFTTYPHMRFLKNKITMGAGYARNRGAEIARAPLLLFLDADDWLYPDALEKMLNAYSIDQGIIYTDYVGKAYITDELAKQYGDRLLYRDASDGHSVIRYNSADYDCERAQQQPRVDRSGYMYVWNLISSLVPAVWHKEIGGFDENMQSWEDWDYWIRMAKAGKCFIHLAEPLMVYRFYTGSRREVGLQEHPDLIQYLEDKYEGIEMSPCCGGKRRDAQVASVPQQQVHPAQAERSLNMSNDDDFVLVLYDHPNRGSHRVVGAATQKDYGYRAGGEEFYVHKDDQAVQPHVFVVRAATPPAVQAPPAAPPPPPPPPPPPSPPEDFTSAVYPEEMYPPEDNITVSDSVGIEVIEDTTMFEQAETTESYPDLPDRDAPFDLQLVPGINATVAQSLNAAGVHTLGQLLEVPNEELVKYKGIGESTAEKIKMFAEKKLAGEM